MAAIANFRDKVLQLATVRVVPIALPGNVTVVTNQVSGLDQLLTGARLSDFSPFKSWNFDTNTDGWSAAGTTSPLTANSNTITLNSTGTDPQLESPYPLNVPGKKFDKIRIRLRRLAGDGWDGYVYFTTATNPSEGGAGSGYLVKPDALVINAWTVLEWDMSGIAGWTSDTIKSFRIDLGSKVGDSFEIDWIAIGRYAVGSDELAASAKAAQDAADSANAAITVISSDSVLSRGEKPQVIQSWKAVSDEYQGIVDQANALQVSHTTYDSVYTALKTFINAISPAYTDLTSDSTVDGPTMRTRFADYYLARQTVLNGMVARNKALADSANTTLDAILSDGVLSKNEKPAVIQAWGAVSDEHQGIANQADNLQVSRASYDTTFTALLNFITAISPAYTDLTKDSIVDGPTMRTKFGDYYLARQSLINAMVAKTKAAADAAAGTANWTSVAGKPADAAILNSNVTLPSLGYTGDTNATAGAPAGTSVGGTEAGLLASRAAYGESAYNAIPGINTAVSSAAKAVFATAPGCVWEFQNSMQGWSVNNASYTLNVDSFTVTGNALYLNIASPMLNITGALSDKLRIRIRRKGGTGWQGKIYYSTPNHPWGEGYTKIVATPPPADGSYVILEWDMATLTTGGSDWTASTIINMRIDLGIGANDAFEIDWIAIGKYGTAPSAEAVTAAAQTTPNLVESLRNWTVLQGAWLSPGNSAATDGTILVVPPSAYAQSHIMNLAPNTDYTLSFKAKATTNISNFSFDLYPDDLPETAFNLTTAFQVFSVKWNSGSGNMTSCVLRALGSPTAQVELCDVKLGMGVIVTPWCDSVVTPGNASTLLQPGSIQSGMVADLRTTNYAQDGAGNPTAGVKLSSTDVALKVASKNLQIGATVFEDYWFRLVQGIDGSYANGRVIWRGNNDITSRGGAPNANCLTLIPMSSQLVQSNFQQVSYAFIIRPTSYIAYTDNLDAMRQIHLRFSTPGAPTTFFTEVYAYCPDRVYDSSSNNSDGSSRGSVFHGWRYSGGGATPGAQGLESSTGVFTGYIRARIGNSYGWSADIDFSPGLSVGSPLGVVSLGGGSSGGGSGGSKGGGGGACPAPWVMVRLISGKEVMAGDLHDGARVAAVDDSTLETLPNGGVIRDYRIMWAKRYQVKLTNGEATEWSENHRFAVVDRGWVHVQDLRPGDHIMGLEECIVESVLYVDEGQVVSFRVEGAGTYFAGKMLSHNLKQLP